MTSYNSTIPA